MRGGRLMVLVLASWAGACYGPVGKKRVDGAATFDDATFDGAATFDSAPAHANQAGDSAVLGSDGAIALEGSVPVERDASLDLAAVDGGTVLEGGVVLDVAAAPDTSASPDAPASPADAAPLDQAAPPDVATIVIDGSVGDSAAAADAPFSDFTKTEFGGYKLGPPLGNGTLDPGLVPGEYGCNQLAGIVRDFRGLKELAGHPDFEAFLGDAPTMGLVGPQLGLDRKPIYASMCETAARTPSCPYGQQTTSAMAFHDWYRSVDGVNKPYLLYLLLVPNAGMLTFSSKHFFPLDNAGWGNWGLDAEANPRNFHFTTELHPKFRYRGGERFALTGDDDVWVFINGMLALDVGGLHRPAFATLELDAAAAKLGLVKEGVFTLDVFHAERRTDASNFRIDTDLFFVDCGALVP